MQLRRAVPDDLASLVALQKAAYARNEQLLGAVPLPLTADYGQILRDMDVWLVDGTGDLDAALILEFRPGDIQILCNHSIFHSRTAYEDWPEVERRRHLLRLWLASEDGPALPPFMTDRFQGLTAGGRPDGVRVPGVRMVAPLDPL